MKKILQFERYNLLVFFGSALLLAWALDNFWLALALSVTAYALVLLVRLARLQKWLEQGSKQSQLFDDNGIVGQIVQTLYRQKIRYQKRKKKTKDILRRLHTNISAVPDATIVLNDSLEIEWLNYPAMQLLGINPSHDLGYRITHLIRSPLFSQYLDSHEYESPIELPSPVNPETIIQIRLVKFGQNQRLLVIRDVSSRVRMNEALKNFVANASHELKTPLTVISGHLEMLENDPDQNEPAKRSIASARLQVRRMEQLIKDQLVLSRLESSQLTPSEGQILDLNEITDSALSLLDRRCNRDRIHCSVPTNAGLLGKRSDIESILVNLVDNALKHSADDVQVVIEWNTADSGEVVLTVSDDGEGIDARDLPNVMQRYYRGTFSGHTEREQGSGLGLAIVKHAVLKHGGNLNLKSSSQGTVFTLKFPEYRNPENVHRLENPG